MVWNGGRGLFSFLFLFDTMNYDDDVQIALLTIPISGGLFLGFGMVGIEKREDFERILSLSDWRRLIPINPPHRLINHVHTRCHRIPTSPLKQGTANPASDIFIKLYQSSMHAGGIIDQLCPPNDITVSNQPIPHPENPRNKSSDSTKPINPIGTYHRPPTTPSTNTLTSYQPKKHHQQES